MRPMTVTSGHLLVNREWERFVIHVVCDVYIAGVIFYCYV